MIYSRAVSSVRFDSSIVDVEPKTNSTIIRADMLVSLSLVIATQNRHNQLLSLLSSLNVQLIPFSNIETYVIQDGPPFLSSGVFSRFDRLNCVIVDLPESKGIAGARNEGIIRAERDIIGFLDDDSIPCDDWFSAVYQFALRFPQCWVFGGVVYPQDRAQNLYSALRHFVYYYETFGPNYYHSGSATVIGHEPRIIRYASGGNSAYRKEVFKAYGFFNEGLPAYVDVEFALRLSPVHKPCLNRAMSIHHAHPSSFRQYVRRAYKSGEAKYVVMTLHRGEYLFSSAKGVIWDCVKNILVGNVVRLQLLPNRHIKSFLVLLISEIVHLLGFLRRWCVK